jgi:hypothetical protein
MRRFALLAALALCACTLHRGLRSAPYIDADSDIAQTLINAQLTEPQTTISIATGSSTKEPLCEEAAPDPQHTCPAKAADSR